MVTTQTAPILQSLANQWRGRAGTVPAYGPLPHPGVSGVVSTLQRGTRSTCMQIIGDSTGTDPDEWWGIMSRKVAAAYPAYTVLWRQWNDTTQDYDLPTNLMINTSHAADSFQVGAGGDRRVTLTSGGLNYASASITGDIDVRVKHTPAAGWTPGGAAATRTLVSHYNASGTNRGWLLWLDSTGHLNWTWSAAGSADTASVVSTAVVPFADGTPGWLRCVHDVDNGATGNDVKFYTSTDGATWTQLGTTVTTAATTTLAAAAGTQTVIGSRNGGGADYASGDYYWVEVRNGIVGTNTVPPLPDDWDRITTASSVVYTGAPILMLLCGSMSGQNLTYFNDPTRRPKMLIPHGQDVVFVNTSHNEGNPTNTTWITNLSAYVTALRTAVPNVPVIAVAQNPTTTPLTPTIIGERAARGAQLMTYAASAAGVYGVDPWPAFAGLDPTTVIETSDGIHPTQGSDDGTSGSDLWGSYVYEQLFV